MRLQRWLLLAGACLLPLTATAQFEPDVPYVTTATNVVETMLDMAQVTAKDNLIDLGSGDGRIVIDAVKKRGASGTGIELSPHLVRIAREEAAKQGVAARAVFKEGNLFNFDLHEASVLTMYLFPQINIRLRPRLFEQLKPGTRVVSHDFHMDAWQPDMQREVPVPGKSYGPPRSTIYLWVIPANAAGTWRWRLLVNNTPMVFEATIAQRFQKPEITASIDGVRAPASEVELRGNQLRFRLTRQHYGQPLTLDFSGRIADDEAAGTVKVSVGEDATLEWRAARSERGKIRLD
jgi:hypothetical protein